MPQFGLKRNPQFWTLIHITAELTINIQIINTLLHAWSISSLWKTSKRYKISAEFYAKSNIQIFRPIDKVEVNRTRSGRGKQDRTALRNKDTDHSGGDGLVQWLEAGDRCQ